MEIEIDFSGISDLESMHTLLKWKFGFPEFYGKNVNVLIDCWTSLRYPEDGMLNIALEKEEALNLIVKSMPLDNILILNHFLISIESVNKRYKDKGQVPPINLILV